MADCSNRAQVRKWICNQTELHPSSSQTPKASFLLSRDIQPDCSFSSSLCVFLSWVAVGIALKTRRDHSILYFDLYTQAITFHI